MSGSVPVACLLRVRFGCFGSVWLIVLFMSIVAVLGFGAWLCLWFCVSGYFAGLH